MVFTAEVVPCRSIWQILMIGLIAPADGLDLCGLSTGAWLPQSWIELCQTNLES